MSIVFLVVFLASVPPAPLPQENQSGRPGRIVVKRDGQITVVEFRSAGRLDLMVWRADWGERFIKGPYLGNAENLYRIGGPGGEWWDRLYDVLGRMPDSVAATEQGKAFSALIKEIRDGYARMDPVLFDPLGEPVWNWNLDLDAEAYAPFLSFKADVNAFFDRMNQQKEAARLGVDLDKYNPLNNPDEFDEKLAEAREAEARRAAEAREAEAREAEARASASKGGGTDSAAVAPPTEQEPRPVPRGEESRRPSLPEQSSQQEEEGPDLALVAGIVALASIGGVGVLVLLRGPRCS